MKKLKKSSMIYFLLLIVLGSSCLSLKEINGSCTKCLPVQILDKGFCYEKLKGCLVQKALACTTCQNGYVLSNQSCIREALFFNNTNLTPPPIIIDQPKLNASQIQSLDVAGFQQTKNFQSNLYLAARKKLIDDYPILKNITIYKTEEQSLNGMNFVFYMIDLNDYALYLANVHVNLKLESEVIEIYKNSVSIQKNPALTEVFTINWEIFTKYQDTQFIQSKRFLFNSISELSKYQIKKVEFQRTAGYNFLFELTSNQIENNIFVKVYSPFYGRKQILGVWQSPKTQIQKPIDFNPSEIQTFNISIQQKPATGVYSYKTDPIFADLYNFFKNQIKVTNLAPISKVEKVQSDNSDYWIYKIIYSSQEYAIVNYYPNYSIFEIISYIVGNTQIYSLESLRKKSSQRSQQILAERLKMEDPIKFANILIKSIAILKISTFTSIYQLNIYTTQGNFNISILDRGQLFIIKIQKINNDNCFQINTKNVNPTNSQQSTIQQIKIILLSKFSFAGYQLASAFVRIFKPDNFQYTLLWSRIDLRKIRVSLEITQKKLTVKKISYISNGTYIAKQDSTLVIEGIARKQFPELKDLEKVQTLTNGSLYKIHFVNSTHVQIYTKNILKDKSTLQFFELGKSVSCLSENQDILLINFKGKCYKKIENCGVQFGNVCTICDKQSLQFNGKCVRHCEQIFSDF